MELQNMSAHDLERIAELKQLGFELVECGFRNTHGEHVTSICYWRHMRGRRVSALQPNPEAAWLDAIRTYEATEDKVKERPGVHVLPAKDSPYLSVLKRKMQIAGFVFGNDGWVWGTQKADGLDSNAAIKTAAKVWARDKPDDFIDAMNEISQGVSQALGPINPAINKRMAELVKASNYDFATFWLTPLTSEELAKLQGLPGYAELPDRDKLMTIESQQLLKHLKQRGIQIDMSLIDPGALVEAASVSYKSQGKSFEEVEEDQRRAKRAYGLVEGSEEEKQLRHLEAIGYEFYFTSTWGWKCKPDVKASGALETVVKAAWIEAITTLKDGPAWDGESKPPVGVTLWVTPHNLIWGFNVIEPHLCQVLAYRDEYVWLEILSDIGETTYNFTTTRTDKVEFKVWKGNNHA